VGAAGLPAREWADAAKLRLQHEQRVEFVRVDVVEEFDEDERPFPCIELAVCLRALDAESAATLVEREFVRGLADVVGDEEVGWTAYTWEAVLDDAAP
jgi:hypothetical protein